MGISSAEKPNFIIMDDADFAEDEENTEIDEDSYVED